MNVAPLRDKTALVTGSSLGIGRAIACALAAYGANVVINYPFDAEADHAAEVAERVNASGGRALCVRADVTRVHEIRSLFEQAAAKFGSVDIVVSNAGGGSHFNSIAEVSEAEYDAVTALNGRAHFFVLREAARRLRDNGRIVVIATSATAMTLSGSAAYAGAKAAAELYARVLAKEIGNRGITVNSVSPGPILTASARESGQLERFELARKMTPLGRLGEPEDVADVVAFLATHEARWITGQNIRAGGGIV
jgi:3-oxoacyl-[acyl-carrier protein] reductase